MSLVYYQSILSNKNSLADYSVYAYICPSRDVICQNNFTDFCHFLRNTEIVYFILSSLFVFYNIFMLFFFWIFRYFVPRCLYCYTSLYYPCLDGCCVKELSFIFSSFAYFLAWEENTFDFSILLAGVRRFSYLLLINIINIIILPSIITIIINTVTLTIITIPIITNFLIIVIVINTSLVYSPFLLAYSVSKTLNLLFFFISIPISYIHDLFLWPTNLRDHCCDNT